MVTSNNEITEALFNDDFWNPLGIHLGSYIKTPLQLRYVSSKTSIIGRALRHAIVDLLDNITNKPSEHIENDTTVLGTEHRVYHSRNYSLKIKEDDMKFPELNDNDDEINFEIRSLAPTVFSRLRKDVGISDKNFRHSFSEQYLKDFTNPGKSGSLMYKTSDDLFILKTLREYEARLLMQILSGYHLQLTQRPSIFNRYIGLYSVRLQATITTIQIYIVIMANAFTPALRINQVFDLKGSKINRTVGGRLSVDKLHKLKDLDFMDLYPYGIRIPTNIYQKLKIVIANDVKVLKKLNITDFSLLLGIRHLDMTNTEIMQHQSTTGVAALCHLSNSLGLMQMVRSKSEVSSVEMEKDLTGLPVSYLKPLEMLNEKIDMNLYYNDDSVAYTSLPIPGIINKSNQRVYIYLVFVDMLQTFDGLKHLDQTFRKLKNHNTHLEYSVIEPDNYEKRINQFLFDQVFIDANGDFPWAITDISKVVSGIHNEGVNNKKIKQLKTNSRIRSHSAERSPDSVLEFRF